MNATKNVNVRIKQNIKEEASEVLNAIGLTISDAVRLLLTKIAYEKALPFSPLIPNETTIKAMKEAETGNLDSFDSVEELLDALNAKD